MRKTIPFIVIGFLILSSIGVNAIQEENNINHESLMQFELEIIAKGGFGIRITVLNRGSEPYEEPINFNVTIEASLMLIGKKNNLPINLPIPAGGSITVSTGFVLGYGICNVVIVTELGETPDVYEAIIKGFIFWPIILFKATTIPIE